MTKEILFIKNFSNIGELQHSRKIEYYLTQNDADTLPFGIELCEVDGKGEKSRFIGSVSSSPDEASDIAAYLFENAVDTALCGDVIRGLTVGE